VSLCRTHVFVHVAVFVTVRRVSRRRRRRRHRRRGESLESLSSPSVAISPSLNVFLSLPAILSLNSSVCYSLPANTLPYLTLPYPYPYPYPYLTLSRAPKSEYYAPLPCVYDRCVLLSAVSLSSHLHSCRGQVSRGSSGGEPTPVCSL